MKTVEQNTATTNIEKALKIESIRNLTKINADGIDRVYFGHEFCERLLPDLTHFKQAINQIRKNKQKLSLLTPSVTEYGFDNVRSLISALNEDDEVVVNDWGVLHMVETEFKNPVLIGRILNRIVVPALMSLRGSTDSFDQYLSLLGERVQGVEVDSFNVSIIDAFFAEKMHVSLYTAPVVWTTTKRCVFNVRANTLRKFCMCKKECLKCRAIIENVAAKKKFLLSGNVIFGLSSDAPRINKHAWFKRVVFEPKSEDQRR